jgi:deoxyribose-phosphate aldolase
MDHLLKFPEDEQTIRKICSMIDYTEALNPNCTSKDVVAACAVVRKYKFSAMVCYPTWVKLAEEHMRGSGIPVQTPIGYPHGATTIETKSAEVRQALIDGAREIDMVVNIARFLDSDDEYVKRDIGAVVKICAEYQVDVKAIIEVGYLSDAQKRQIVELAIAAGAKFIKTSTGFGPGRATMHDIALLVEAVKCRCQVKATGSVASLEDQLAFIELGATRVAGRGHIVDQLKLIGMD